MLKLVAGMSKLFTASYLKFMRNYFDSSTKLFSDLYIYIYIYIYIYVFIFLNISNKYLFLYIFNSLF